MIETLTFGGAAIVIARSFERGFAALQSNADFPGMIERKPDHIANLLDLRRADRRAVGKAHHPPRQTLGFRQQQSGMRETGAIRLHTMAPWKEITPRQDIFSREELHQFIARQAGGGLVHLEHDVLEIATLAGI